jgi:hypothetical protein
LQAFIDQHPDHELVPVAKVAMAGNLEATGKTDEALTLYKQAAGNYAKSFVAPLALLSEVALLKARNQTEEARRVCETVLTQYSDSFWAGEAMRELRSLKPPSGTQGSGAAAGNLGIPPSLARPAAVPPPVAVPAGPPPAPTPPKPK